MLSLHLCDIAGLCFLYSLMKVICLNSVQWNRRAVIGAASRPGSQNPLMNHLFSFYLMCGMNGRNPQGLEEGRITVQKEPEFMNEHIERLFHQKNSQPIVRSRRIKCYCIKWLFFRADGFTYFGDTELVYVMTRVMALCGDNGPPIYIKLSKFRSWCLPDSRCTILDR